MLEKFGRLGREARCVEELGMSTDALDDGGAEPAPWSDAGAKPAASDPAPPPADAESSVDYESASLVSPLKGVQGAESVAGLTSPSKYPLASPGKASATPI